jgi:hypothetical protein
MSSEISEIQAGNCFCDFVVEDFGQFRSTGFQLANTGSQPSSKVGGYFGGGTPRSLHILRARTSTISLCLGTADLLFNDGLYHQECLAPSLTNSQP